jgi:hypothetical protein
VQSPLAATPTPNTTTTAAPATKEIVFVPKPPVAHPHQWGGPPKVFTLDSLGIHDKKAFALDGHRQSAMRCVGEGVVAIFCPSEKFVRGDIVTVFTHDGTQFFGRYFPIDRKHIVIVADSPMLHGNVVRRNDIKLIAPMVERRIMEPHGPAVFNWSRYATEGPQRHKPITDGSYFQRERRIDARITSERVFDFFRRTGDTKSPCPVPASDKERRVEQEVEAFRRQQYIRRTSNES